MGLSPRESPIKILMTSGIDPNRKEKKLKILVIGDVTSPSGIEHLKRNLWKFRRERGIDFCIVNGENASLISGISKDFS